MLIIYSIYSWVYELPSIALSMHKYPRYFISFCTLVDVLLWVILPNYFYTGKYSFSPLSLLRNT